MQIDVIPAGMDETAQAINNEYALMTGDMTRAVQRAIRIGEMLTEAKAQVQHGEWIPWVEQNLVFGRTQASHYMRVFRERDNPNVQLSEHLSQAIALLAEPKDEPADSIEPSLDTEPEEYRNDPALVDRLEKETEISNNLAARIRELEEESKVGSVAEEAIQQTLEAQDKDLQEAIRELEEARLELTELRRLKADKERVETALKDLQRLEERKTELFKDAESTKLVHQVLLRSREFFTRECMQIAALQLRPESVEVMKLDFAGLIELVENWLEAMKARFQ